LSHKVDNQWIYYCCGHHYKVSNRYLSMPSYRNRIMGLQLYKYKLKGFLQWGYNFYYSELSNYEINPYLTTGAEGRFPSGDAFTVYPGKNGPYLSIRALIFYEGLQDISALRLLEKKVGRKKALEIVVDAANMDITFEDYPRNSEFLPSLRDKIIDILL
ncbi:MAG: DUF4091 domain-containing protein, partial [Bacillota bacterium]|nr:DUF4091 domain-containing protein [Bacillota bacterium]